MPAYSYIQPLFEDRGHKNRHQFFDNIHHLKEQIVKDIKYVSDLFKVRTTLING